MKIKTFLIFAFLLIVSWCIVPLSAAKEPSLDDFISRMQESLKAKNFDSYYEAFAPEIREEEKINLTGHFNNFGMDTVRLHPAGRSEGTPGRPRVFLYVFYQNAYSAMVESWQLELEQAEGRWLVRKKTVSGSVGNLYRIELPPGKAERAESVEIEHVDIKIVFKNALVFYDNIPGLETALLVMGQGRLLFSPSDPIEKHQLQLIYKTSTLDDKLEYVFVRCSNSFFNSRLKIQRGRPDSAPPATESEKARAVSIFARNYTRSFTIQSSLDNEVLSFLPQGDEVVLDFKGAKTGEMTYVYHPFSSEEIHLYDRSREKIVNLYSPQAEGEEKGRRLFISFGQKFDVQDYNLEVDYRPAQSYLSAKARIRVASSMDGLDGVKFNLNPSLEILKIYDRERRELFYTRDRLRNILYIYFIEAVRRQESAEIEVYYRGKIIPPAPATDVAIQSAANEQRIIFSPRYETVLFTQSAMWYPAPSDEDYFTARLKMIIPTEYKCVSNGEMISRSRLNRIADVDVSELEKMGNPVYIFETRSPVKYLSFIVGKIDPVNEAKDPVPIQSFASADVGMMRRGFADQAKDILDFYIPRFGPFPFGRLSIVQRLWSTGGGHSPASFIVLNELPWISDRSLGMSVDSPVNLARWDEYFLAHEIAHQWWGQGVTWTSYRDHWLSEGLSQYAAAIYLEKRYGEKVFASILKKFSRWTEKKSKKGPIVLGSRLSYFDFEAFQAIVYNKSALALNMLHDLLGEEAFFSGLREFYKTYEFRAARTENFIKSMEKASGKDLKEFFRGWFYSYGLPVVDVDRTEELHGSQYGIKLRVHQTADTFCFPLWVEWVAGGKTVREKVTVDEKTREFFLPTDGRPEKVRINPDKAVPGKFF